MHTSHVQALEEYVTQDLFQAVCKEFPADPPAPSKREVDQATHDGYAHEVTRLFVGQKDALKQLWDYAMEVGGRRRLLLVTQ